MKTRFSITMDGEILNNLDSVVDGKHIRSRSEAIETIVKRFLEAHKVAVFLGGGDPEKLKLGSTFRPLVKINGAPLISYSIKNLRKAGFRKIHIIGRPDLIGELFKELGNGEKLGVSLNYIEEAESLGEFKTLQKAEKELNSPFLMLQIDNYFSFDLNELFKAFTFNSGLMTLAVQATPVSGKKGVVEMLGSKITSFEENPEEVRSALSSTTMGICDPAIFNQIPKGRVKFTKKELFPQLISSDQLDGFIIKGPWFNIHTQEDVRVLEKFLKNL